MKKDNETHSVGIKQKHASTLKTFLFLTFIPQKFVLFVQKYKQNNNYNKYFVNLATKYIILILTCPQLAMEIPSRARKDNSKFNPAVIAGTGCYKIFHSFHPATSAPGRYSGPRC